MEMPEFVKVDGDAMAAKKGNKYAQKHCKEEVLELLENMQTILINGEAKTLAGACTKSGIHSQKLKEWSRTWAEDKEVCTVIKRVRAIALDILEESTISGDVVPSVGIFLMKVHSGYRETQEVNMSVSSKYECGNLETDV